jgi:hypothetical protein
VFAFDPVELFPALTDEFLGVLPGTRYNQHGQKDAYKEFHPALSFPV